MKIIGTIKRLYLLSVWHNGNAFNVLPFAFNFQRISFYRRSTTDRKAALYRIVYYTRVNCPRNLCFIISRGYFLWSSQCLAGMRQAWPVFYRPFFFHAVAMHSILIFFSVLLCRSEYYTPRKKVHREAREK